MQAFVIFVFVLIAVLVSALAAPVDVNNSSKELAFGSPFDEILVESSLTVRRKTNARQSRNEDPKPATVVGTKVKRQIFGPQSFGNFPNFPSTSAAAANAQAQAFDTKSPLGNFGSSATGTHTQAFQFGPGGLSGAAGISGTQQYRLANGQTVDITYGNTFSAANGNPADASSHTITISGVNGEKSTIG